MPELPEVESVRRAAERALSGRSFERIDAADGRGVLSRVTARELEKALIGRRVERVARRGKYFWLELSDGKAVLMHLGMTGWMSFPRAREPLPPYTRVCFHMDDGSRAAFTDPRRFGKIRLFAGSPESEAPVRHLGTDPLDRSLDAKALAEKLSGRRRPIKGILLDQRIFAGVGNWIADEVLYQAAIRPDRAGADLSAAEVRRLCTTLHRILQRAVEVEAESDRFPKSWLFHHRWGKKSGARTARGEAIAHTTIAGRTTAWVPSRQR